MGPWLFPFSGFAPFFTSPYFGFAAHYFRRTSVRQDSDGDPKWSIQMRGFSFPGIILFAACTTLMAFDWFSSPDYRWASTMWGVYIFAGAAGAGMAMIILVVIALKNAGYLQFVNEEHYHIMGKLLFVFSIFWGYIGFSQYMLIWYANIPEETEWFLRTKYRVLERSEHFSGHWPIFYTVFLSVVPIHQEEPQNFWPRSRSGCWECISWTLTSPSCRFCTRKGLS